MQVERNLQVSETSVSARVRERVESVRRTRVCSVREKHARGEETERVSWDALRSRRVRKETRACGEGGDGGEGEECVEVCVREQSGTVWWW